MSGRKIIEGLQEAVAGNFSRVTIEGQTWVRLESDVAPAARTPADLTIAELDQIAREAFSEAAAKADIARLNILVEAMPSWQPIETAPRGERILLCWDAASGLKAHVELGKRSETGAYTNTYGKAFSGKPDRWMALPSTELRHG